MKEFITILFMVFIGHVAHAAIDSSAVVIKSIDTRNNKNTTIDSAKIKTKKTTSDSSLSKTNADTVSAKPDSLQKFVDKNGDGFNDNAPDHDGDGIPDALDKDYWALKGNDSTKPEDGVPPSVLGLDRKPGNIAPKKQPPGIKFDMRGRRGKKR